MASGATLVVWRWSRWTTGSGRDRPGGMEAWLELYSSRIQAMMGEERTEAYAVIDGEMLTAGRDARPELQRLRLVSESDGGRRRGRLYRCL